MYVDIKDFVGFVKTKEGQELLTRARGRKFTVQVTKNGFEYMPLSTMKARPHQTRYMEMVIDQFNRTKSFKPSEYHHLTVCASYTLALIGLYRDQLGTYNIKTSLNNIISWPVLNNHLNQRPYLISRVIGQGHVSTPSLTAKCIYKDLTSLESHLPSIISYR